ncbi:40S ribosomal protein S17-like [Nycticebus coucang]|uniref:40S ribosomal protein S17-like n=1 Tax=Nycticebus coucang TaxID=9470 RepID=UPI00234CC459|nr:40S ribosomal protein S17-like [Nycticebus coucang]
MGRVSTKTVKRATPVIIKKYYRRLGTNFHTKRVCEEVAFIPSKRLHNKTADCATPLMKWIQRGPGRGNSIRLQEEERERRENSVPEVSAL